MERKMNRKDIILSLVSLKKTSFPSLPKLNEEQFQALVGFLKDQDANGQTVTSSRFIERMCIFLISNGSDGVLVVRRWTDPLRTRALQGFWSALQRRSDELKRRKIVMIVRGDPRLSNFRSSYEARTTGAVHKKIGHT